MASPSPQDHYAYTPAATLSTRALLTNPPPGPTRTESSISSVSAALTPNTRTEAEAALTYNSAQQTDSAAPTSSSTFPTSGAGDDMVDGVSESPRPGLPLRTSSHHYADAVGAAAPTEEDADVGAGYAAEGTEKYVSGRSGVGSQSWRPSGVRQQSYSKEDMRRLMQERLMKEHPTDPGYQSGNEKP
ncbi:hypothetical protein W97_02832 [Coniosporium apollinis CBS 100218]|uniref:Uncharacterized protein n=1 Tax=Coniosporium apollinis (strain CBS 100218) TaxID=1168221 RepID=R7YP83_CONA1|nr:uncharacterized protein W97_02832 [Coniosporium apollinis CBS 100218]EON63604.1 hypothetical protein W97_02832 [Coniosporium apollinis CBS 100218]